MTPCSYQDLDSLQKSLLDAAVAAAKRAYCPYSGYSVGAALRTTDGQVIIGANVENAAYGSTICAEQSAVVSANSQGFRSFTHIAVIGRPVAGESEQVTAPCGACRQVLFEFSQLAGRDLDVIISNSNQSSIVLTTINELLPLGFGPESLKF